MRCGLRPQTTKHETPAMKTTLIALHVLWFVVSAWMVYLLFTGCCTDKRYKREYHRGWHEGFDAAEETIVASERVIQMRKEMRGEAPKRFTP